MPFLLKEPLVCLKKSFSYLSALFPSRHRAGTGQVIIWTDFRHPAGRIQTQGIGDETGKCTHQSSDQVWRAPEWRHISLLIVFTPLWELPLHPHPCPVLTCWAFMKTWSCLSHSCWRWIKKEQISEQLKQLLGLTVYCKQGLSCLCECQKSILRYNSVTRDNREYGVCVS